MLYENVRLNKWLSSHVMVQVGAEFGNPGWDWRPVEASLYCIRAIAKAVPVEDTLLPRVSCSWFFGLVTCEVL